MLLISLTSLPLLTGAGRVRLRGSGCGIGGRGGGQQAVGEPKLDCTGAGSGRRRDGDIGRTVVRRVLAVVRHGLAVQDGAAVR